MLLYKSVPTYEIAKQVSIGVFRFYELVKYIKLEKDEFGRSDQTEGSVNFPDDDTPEFIKKLPTGSYEGIEFQCQSIEQSEEYLRQYFIFCMSTAKTDCAIGDCKFAVELQTDIFETIERFLHEYYGIVPDDSERRIFSHGAINYYDIDNHPASIENCQWREVYMKHSRFAHQEEYRAALFVSDSFFSRTCKIPMVIEREIRKPNGDPLPFNLKFILRSGVDEAGWRYVELDVSEFQNNLVGEPNKIIAFGN